MTKGVAQRFWSKVAIKGPDECWVWTKSIRRPNGYGAFRLDGRTCQAHRVSYELSLGPIPAGTEIDHRCRNRLCVNPAHLRPATGKQNHENQGPQPIGKTGIRGVSWDRRSSKWHVQVTHNNRNHHGGLFDDIKEAEAAAIALRNRLFTHNIERPVMTDHRVLDRLLGADQ